MNETFDSIILGTGHNALVLQAYLSRCGLRTLALERAACPGGGLSTIENPRRPGFFEIEGRSNVYYVFKYPSGTKVMLIGVWERDSDPVADLVACTCPAA